MDECTREVGEQGGTGIVPPSDYDVIYGVVRRVADEYSEMIPRPHALSTQENERRALEFLVAMAKLSNLKKACEDAKIEASSLEKAVYAASIHRAGGKNITEKKVEAEADGEYMIARELFEKFEVLKSFIDAYYGIFENAHIMYRNLSKE